MIPGIPFLFPHAQWNAVLRPALLRGQPRSGTGPVRVWSFTCLITVLAVGTLHTLKAAGGLPLNDPLPGPCQTVPAAVGEGHLQAEKTEGRGGMSVSRVSPTTHAHSEESGYVRSSVADSGSF